MKLETHPSNSSSGGLGDFPFGVEPILEIVPLLVAPGDIKVVGPPCNLLLLFS
jgi:hypothetical protein